MSHAQQQEFDNIYITGNEICETYNISRSTLYQAKQRNILPPPVIIAGSKTQIWIRSEVTENLERWSFNLKARRRQLPSTPMEA